jgi:hypothetical protein
MLPSDNRGSLDLRLVLASAAMTVAAVGATVLALLDLPQVLVVGLALFAALALIDVAGTLSTRPAEGPVRPPNGEHRHAKAG